MEPRFYLSNKLNKQGRSTVMLYLYCHGKRITISTGKVIKPTNWNENAQRARGTSAETMEFNNYLQSFGASAVSKLTELIQNQEQDILVKFKQQIKQIEINNAEKVRIDLSEGGSLVQFMEKLIPTLNRTSGTLAQYLTTLKNLKSFQKNSYKRPVHFESIDMDFYNAYVSYCQIEKEYSVNTIGKEVKHIKFFMAEAEERELHSNFKFKSKRFKKTTEESFSVYLSEDQIKTLSVLNLENNPNDEVIRDLFVASCWLGLRVGNLLEITKSHIHGNIISIRSEKTSEFIDIPLHPIVKKTIIKYGGLLPNALTEWQVNRRIKDIVKMAGFTDNVAYSITKGGRKVSMTEPFYSLVTTHTARRSFATNMYKRGINIQTIMAITGHNSERTFMSYVKSKRINAVKEMEDIFRK
ncbi:site-specific integrase [Rhizosphaericola mali]|uniref:Site-specific integrase n=2 Tax=Rhizosphaericola mali TaxID=2545455 RepID=A0A5P2G4T3_9BACT|nr:site-specific integrase [Rhizosphaericola mali]QES88103.1 site-specific integrase [Rhizosphaericola mali]